MLNLTGSTQLGALSGAVALLNFTSAAGPEGATGALTISAATVNGGAVSNERTGGSITLLRRFAISGAVTYWKDAKVVPDANLVLTSNDLPTDITGASAASDAAGAFGWAQIYEGNHTLTPSKTGNDNGITAYDAALALRHSVSLAPLTGKALIVADVTGAAASPQPTRRKSWPRASALLSTAPSRTPAASGASIRRRSPLRLPGPCPARTSPRCLWATHPAVGRRAEA